MNPDAIYTLALTYIPKVGPVNQRKLLALADAKSIWSLSKKEQDEIFRGRKDILTYLRSSACLDLAQKELEFCEKNNIEVLLHSSESYREKLKNCIDSPLVLFKKGNHEFKSQLYIAIVGTRKMTAYGKNFIDNLVQGLATHQMTIVSGLAYGCDIEAHKASNRNGVPNIAVLAHGLHKVAPAAHQKEARDLQQKGALVSEYSSFHNPEPMNFVLRNRIIAGICDAVIVVESDKKGGALATAQYANAYNREVFAIPGKPTDKMSQGCHNLIKQQKANLLTSATDLIYMLNWDLEKPKAQQQKLFVELSPDEARGDTLTAFDLLARGTERIEAELAGQPAVQGHLLLILSRIYERLGDGERALSLAERSLEVRRVVFGERHPDVAESENQIGSVHQALGDYDAAEAHLRRAVALRRDLLAPGDSDLSESVMNLGLLLSYSGAYDEAEPLLREALALDRARHGDEHADVATDLNNLAILLYFKGDYGGAEEALREALAIRRAVYGEPHPRVAVTLNNLAAILRRTGDLAAAEPLFRESLAMSRALVGNAHPDVASTLSNLAAVVGERGRPGEAEALLREAVAIGRGVHGEHPELADALSNLGRTLLDLDRLDEAEAALAEALAMNRATRGAEHARTALATYNLGRVAEARGDDRAAERLFREALALQERVLPPEHDETAFTCSSLGHVLVRLQRYDEARPLLARAHTALLATYGAEDPRVREAAERLAALPVGHTVGR